VAPFPSPALSSFELPRVSHVILAKAGIQGSKTTSPGSYTPDHVRGGVVIPAKAGIQCKIPSARAPRGAIPLLAPLEWIAASAKWPPRNDTRKGLHARIRKGDTKKGTLAMMLLHRPCEEA
jgi:hypothetical protein